MSWERITPPTGLALSLAEAQLAARVDVDEQGKSSLDADIEAAIRTYTSEAEGETNRAIMEQTWGIMLDRFPAVIELTRSPLLEVVHVKYRDTDGELQTLDPQDCFVAKLGQPARLMPAPGLSWPATAVRADAVEIEIRCGYGADDTAVPDSIKGFLRARIAEQFSTGKHADNPNVRRLLWPEVVCS